MSSGLFHESEKKGSIERNYGLTNLVNGGQVMSGGHHVGDGDVGEDGRLELLHGDGFCDGRRHLCAHFLRPENQQL